MVLPESLPDRVWHHACDGACGTTLSRHALGWGWGMGWPPEGGDLRQPMAEPRPRRCRDSAYTTTTVLTTGANHSRQKSIAFWTLGTNSRPAPFLLSLFPPFLQRQTKVTDQHDFAQLHQVPPNLDERNNEPSGSGTTLSLAQSSLA